MPNIEIKKDLYNDIVDFCQVNDIQDINDFINQVLVSGFDMKTYGDSFAMFFGKSESDIVHIKPEEESVSDAKPLDVVVPEEPIETKEVKKRGRKKKIEETVVVDQIQPEVIVETEPSYVIKQEEKPKEKIQVRLKRPDDNYGVYDEF